MELSENETIVAEKLVELKQYISEKEKYIIEIKELNNKVKILEKENKSLTEKNLDLNNQLVNLNSELQDCEDALENLRHNRSSLPEFTIPPVLVRRENEEFERVNTPPSAFSIPHIG